MRAALHIQLWLLGGVVLSVHRQHAGRGTHRERIAIVAHDARGGELLREDAAIHALLLVRPAPAHAERAPTAH